MKNIFSEVLMKFEKVGSEIGKLVDEKNAAYGSSFENQRKF